MNDGYINSIRDFNDVDYIDGYNKFKKLLKEEMYEHLERNRNSYEDYEIEYMSDVIEKITYILENTEPKIGNARASV